MNIKTKIDLMRKDLNEKGFNDLPDRKRLLIKLNNAIVENKELIIEAINKDTNKHEIEIITSEISSVLKEISYFLKNLKKLLIKRKYTFGAPNLFSSYKLKYEPYGISLIISPYNFPFSLALRPLVGAIASGNKVILKVSERSTNTHLVIKKIVESAFNEKEMLLLENNLSPLEMNKIYSYGIDYIFFTGSSKVGKLINQEASKYNIPLTLELGGANPTIILKDANYKFLAKRLIWAKLYSGSQVCMAPNHLYLPENKLDLFLSFLKEEINKQMDKTTLKQIPFQNLDHKKMSGELLIKKPINPNLDFIVEKVNENNINVLNETFSMIIPIVLYKDEKDLLNKIGKTNDPLVMYFFTKNIKQEIVEKITKRYRSGTVSFNEFIYFINIKNYPFGGIGNSGNGKYGNKYSLYTFSYLRPYFKKNTKYDFKSLYYPYTDKKLNFISKLIKIKQK